MSEVVVVKVIVGSDWNDARRETLVIDGKEVMYVGCLSECPEDAMLERDLKGPSDFVSLLKSFLIEHKGKKVKFIYEDEKEDEDE